MFFPLPVIVGVSGDKEPHHYIVDVEFAVDHIVFIQPYLTVKWTPITGQCAVGLSTGEIIHANLPPEEAKKRCEFAKRHG